MSEKITLTGVPETMLQTVYARAKETKTRGAIHDEKAVELVEKLEYDFSLADKDTPMHSGVIARTIVLDRLVKEFLEQHPGAIVVNIACGLDTRCYRLNGYTHWYNLDLPETIAVREKLLPESGCVTAIAQSAMEPWGNQIKEQDVPVLIIIEGLTMYLTEADVKQIFAVISERFLQATVLVETMNPAVVKRFKEKSIDASNAKFTWGIPRSPLRTTRHSIASGQTRRSCPSFESCWIRTASIWIASKCLWHPAGCSIFSSGCRVKRNPMCSATSPASKKASRITASLSVVPPRRISKGCWESTLSRT